MSRKGGYKIINLKGKAITTGEEITINGLYKEIDATDKACLISGAVVDNIEIDDFYMLFEKAGDHYIGITGDNKLTIGEYDTLLWEDYKPSGSAAYTAGDYIQITGDVISANTGDDGLATKEELTNAKAEINRELEGKVDEEDLTKDLTSINTSINSLSTTVGEVQEVATSNHEDISNMQAMVETASTNAASALSQVYEKQDKLISGTNIKQIRSYRSGSTVNDSILGSDYLEIKRNDYGHGVQHLTTTGNIEWTTRLSYERRLSSILHMANWASTLIISGVGNTTADITKDEQLFITSSLGTAYGDLDEFGLSNIVGDTFLGEMYYKENGINIKCVDVWLEWDSAGHFIKGVANRDIPKDTTVYFHGVYFG